MTNSIGDKTDKMSEIRVKRLLRDWLWERNYHLKLAKEIEMKIIDLCRKYEVNCPEFEPNLGG